MNRDEKLEEAKELKATSGALLGGYVIGLMMAALSIWADAIAFGIFSTIFLGVFAFLAIYWYAKVSGMEEEGDKEE